MIYATLSIICGNILGQHAAVCVFQRPRCHIRQQISTTLIYSPLNEIQSALYLNNSQMAVP